MDSPRTLLACAQEGLDANEDFYFRAPVDYLLQCKGDKQSARMKAEHYLQRRDELIDIVTKKREVIIEAMEAAQVNVEAENALMTTTSSSPTSPRPLPGDTASVHSENSAQRASGLLTKKAKLEKQIERMQQVVEANKLRQQQEEEEAKRLKVIFAEKEAERAKQKEHDELERKFKEVQIRRRAQQEREERQRREEERAAELDRQRRERLAVAQQLEEREMERIQKMEEERRRREISAAEKQLEVAMRLEEKKLVAEDVERQRREVIEAKMLEADERREKLEATKEAQLAARKVTSEIKTKENKEKRHRAVKLFVEKITRFEEKSKVAEKQREKQEEELQNYFLHCKLEEAKKERMRREVLKRAHEEEAQREKELQERLAEAEERIASIALEKSRNAVLRKVEKEMILEDKSHQMLRNRRLLEHECAEGKARFEEKIRRIVAMQEESREADSQRRELMRRSILAIKKRIPEPTPGPSDYAVGSAFSFIGHKDGAVKMSNAARGELFAKAEDTPGPGQYAALPKRGTRGGKLKPITVLEKKRMQEMRHTPEPTTSIARFPRHSTPPRALSTPLTAIGLTEEDYNSDEDFD